MLKNALLLILAVLLLPAFTGAAKKDQIIVNANEGTQMLFYAARTKAPQSALPGEHFNYEFISFMIDGEEVRGTMRHYPFGTDGLEASLRGVYKAASNEIHVEAELLMEGEYSRQARTFKLLDGAVQLDYFDAEQKPATLPKVSREAYQALLAEYHSGILRQRVNSTDRSRLLKVEALKKMGYTSEQLQQIKFMELQVDLDRDYQTNEYLLYVMDPMLCGTGGCNLFVINENGQTLSETTVVKLPVYTTSTTIEDQMNNKGVWKELYVWSQGYRRLTPKQGKYPGNASVEAPIVEEQISLHPERFTLLLDYISEK